MLTQLLFTIFLFSSALAYGKVCNDGDKSSLLAFSANLSNSSSSQQPLNWSSHTNCCEWEGVRCDSSGKVTHLELPSRGLVGIITSSIGNLVRLTHLNLSNNYLHGTLGGKVGSLLNLKIIDLSSNSLHDSIPKEIGKLSYLEKLHLYENKFHGPIPSSIMNCSNLAEIILRFNQLDGDISKLDFSRLVHLQKLDLAINKLSGTIPESIYSCNSLVAIRVAQNNLTGEISPKVIGLKSLSFISLVDNFFTNITATLQVLARCRSLSTILLGGNFYGESLPVHSNFFGSNEFPKLQILDLAGCEFSGPFPNWVSKLKNLRVLSLKKNQMTGIVPNWLGTLPKLVNLALSYNRFSGKFPLKLCQLPALSSQNTDNNLTFIQFELPLLLPLPKGKRVACNRGFITTGLGLSNNRFIGNIPPEIGNLQNIISLDLGHNNFSGHIPSELSKLKNLEDLGLDNNHLKGEIPASLASLYFLQDIDVSHNDLEGPIPKGGQFDTFPASSFEGNPRLCGGPLNHPCTQASNGQIVVHKMQHFLNGIFVGFAFGFSGALAIRVKQLLK